MITLNNFLGDFRFNFNGKEGEGKSGENKTKEEFKSVKEIVLNILENEERARNDDKYLTYRVMQHYTDIYINFEDFEKIPAFETIKRVRAKIQNQEGKFMPTSDEVIKHRRQRQDEVKEFIKNE